MRKTSALAILALFCVLLATLYAITYTKVYADLPEPNKDFISDVNLLNVSATWNGIPITANATSSLPINTDGALSWKVDFDPSSAKISSYLPTIANAIYTVQLYKGELGNSELVDSETLEPDATSTDSFPISFPGSGHYFLAYTATYPYGEYPLDFECHGDICRPPQFYLGDFQIFVSRGESEDPKDYGSPVPALFGLLQFDIAEPAGPHDSSILFLPGTMESRLYTKDILGIEHELWEPTHNSDVLDLAMDADGVSKKQVYTRDTVDSLYSSIPALGALVSKLLGNGALMYAPFNTYMDSLVHNGVITEWKAYPYDWRYDVSDIVKNGTMVGSPTSTPTRVYLKDVVKDLASRSPTGKVSIIAHSNGGLLAKALAVQLEHEGLSSLLDKIILVGTPQTGTPSTIGNLLHGDGQTRVLGLLSSGSSVRSVSKNMPGPYDLFPSAAYFSYVETPVATFNTDLTAAAYRSAFGSTIKEFSSLKKFLSDSSHLRTNMNSNDLRTPAVMATRLLAAAQATHDSIDDWVPDSSTVLTSIVGMGQSTISGYDYSGKAILTHTPTVTSQGDGTVVSISAAANPGGSYYFDTGAYRDNSGINISHSNLLSAIPIQNEILNILSGSTTLEAFVSTTTPQYQIVPEVVVSAHSPVTLMATDSSGRQTGTITIPGTDFFAVKQDIPGSSVQTVDDEKYIYLPKTTTPYSFSLEGYDSGTTTIEIGETTADGNIQTLQTLPEIPTTEETLGSFKITTDEVSDLQIDVDGNGSSDTIPSSSNSPTGTQPVSVSQSNSGVHGNSRPRMSAPSPAIPSSTPKTDFGSTLHILQQRVEQLLLEIEAVKLRYLKFVPN